MEEADSIREGGDIFATDMIEHVTKSKIIDTLDDATVFLTGGTGSLGKLFLEKMLRVSPKVKKIYLLVRPKKGKEEPQRFEDIFDGPNMVPMKIANPKYMEKVAMICGDCALPDLGMNEEDKMRLLVEVDYVIHCAATVRFDQILKTATYINVRAVRDLVAMVKKMKNLKGFLYVSTAFSNCPRLDIDEVFYKPVLSADQLLQLVDMLSDERLIAITPGLIGEYPNCYIFTKLVAEDIINTEAKNLPVAVLRPSIITSTVSEPVAGWIDNVYGPTGMFLATALGLLRTAHVKIESIAEVIPADYVVNSGFAVLWKIASEKSLNGNRESGPTEEDNQKKGEIPIYNLVSSVESPISWGQSKFLAEKHGPSFPSEFQVWSYFLFWTANKHVFLMSKFLLHTVPAYIVDFICICIGKKPLMVDGYQRLSKFLDVISYFSLRTWTFKNNNTLKLWQSLGDDDRRLFPFSMKNFDWDTYFRFVIMGVRVYVVKDPLETIPKGRIKYWKLLIAHYTLIAVLFFLFYKLLYLLWWCIF